jgi:diguanylate cyclase (GGDEF)-like protein
MLDLYSENQRLKEEARQLQLIDQDTSLLTKRALLLVLEAQVSRCRRYETPLSVIMMDLNNDGDSAEIKLKLLRLSRLLKDQLRWSDLIARSATKQFTIILPETERTDSASLINKLRDTIDLWGDEYAVNFGLAEWKKGINASDLLMCCEDDMHDRTQSSNNGQDVA